MKRKAFAPAVARRVGVACVACALTLVAVRPATASIDAMPIVRLPAVTTTPPAPAQPSALLGDRLALPQRLGVAAPPLASLAPPSSRGAGAAAPVDAATAAGELAGPLNPLEQTLFADAEGGRLGDADLMRAALVASGADDPSLLRYYLSRAAALAADLRRTQPLGGSPRRQAEVIFDYLHRRVLSGGYNLAYTDLRRVLDEGHFNCVSATVLFAYLAREAGLTATPLETTGHAMCRLQLPQATIDVETTCPRWFRLSDDPQQQRARIEALLGRRAGTAPIKFREVDTAQVAAMIYYNRGVDYLAAKKFAEAAAVNARAMRLDPANATVRGNMLATINNWAIELSGERRYAEAAALLARGTAIDASYETFAVNCAHVYYQWSMELCGADDFGQASTLLDDAIERFPQALRLHEVRCEVYRRWARTKLERDGVGAALTIFDAARRDATDACAVGRVEALELNDWAQRQVADAKFEAALATYDRGLSRQPENDVLRENRLAAVLRWAEAALAEGDFAEGVRRLHTGACAGRAPRDLVDQLRLVYAQWSAAQAAAGHAGEAAAVERRAAEDPLLSEAR